MVVIIAVVVTAIYLILHMSPRERVVIAQAFPKGDPIGLIIPAINVDAIIEPVGLTSSGALGAPLGPVNAGWFDAGTRPGDVGIAIIDGHYGWKDHIPAIFNNLSSLKGGDSVYVDDAKGNVITFVVSKVASYGEYASTSNIFTPYDNKSHLVIVTCAGVWNTEKKSYSKRVVVFADLSDRPL